MMPVPERLDTEGEEQDKAGIARAAATIDASARQQDVEASAHSPQIAAQQYQQA